MTKEAGTVTEKKTALYETELQILVEGYTGIWNKHHIIRDCGEYYYLLMKRWPVSFSEHLYCRDTEVLGGDDTNKSLYDHGVPECLT